VDWDWYLSLLRQGGFGGPVILHGMAEADVVRSLERLRQTLPAPANGPFCRPKPEP
jgi:hypothetical protein